MSTPLFAAGLLLFSCRAMPCSASVPLGAGWGCVLGCRVLRRGTSQRLLTEKWHLAMVIAVKMLRALRHCVPAVGGGRGGACSEAAPLGTSTCCGPTGGPPSQAAASSCSAGGAEDHECGNHLLWQRG